MLVSGDELFQEGNFEAAINVYEEILKADEFEDIFSSRCLLSISLAYGKLEKEDLAKENLFKWRKKHKNSKISEIDQNLLNLIDLELDRLIAAQGEDLTAGSMEADLENNPKD
jgi:lipopolysaccharide biosynthesis regulator YciM